MGDSGRPMRDSVPVELTAKILMTAAVVLFLVVIFVLVLHLYAKWFWARIEESPATAQQNPTRRRRQHRQHRHRRHFVFAAMPHDPARKGLDPVILRSLPTVIFDPEESGEGLECAICLSDLTQGEKARLLPKCNHGFHCDCIDMWFESHSTCPICRNPVGGDSLKSAETDVEYSSSSSSSDGAGDSVEENLSNGQPSESPNFPTNVLFWGNETQVSSRTAACLEEVPSSSSNSTSASSSNSTSAAVGTSSSGSSRVEGVLVIDIPRPIDNSSSRFVEDEPKSPVTTRLRSLKRLLSRERKVNSCSSSSGDAEQV